MELETDGSLGHQVYRKKTHIKQYLHANSHHHPSQKVGVINTLTTHALKISNNEHFDQAKRQLIDSFKKRRYKEWQVEKAF